MKTHEVRQKYIEYYRAHEHAIIASAALVPENDPTTLFTGSGMQPLIPYLLGANHPQGDKLVNSQKCFRSGDIEDVGDNRHTTFFEMLGNWSLGSYFKHEQIPWVFNFLVKEIGIDPQRIYVTAFAGSKDHGLPQDTESAKLWETLFKEQGMDAKIIDIGSEQRGGEVGMQGGRIFYYDAKKNWWSRSGVPQNMPAGEPGGGDSEMFYEFTFVEHDKKYGEHCHPNCDCGRFVEIGNSVFMEYVKQQDGSFSPLPKQNVDFGGGLERIVAASNNSNDIFTIDVFENLISTIEQLTGHKYTDNEYTPSFRVIADHVRSAIFLIGDGVLPSNTDKGYFVRRLIRRAVLYAYKIGIQQNTFSNFVLPLLSTYKDAYPQSFAQAEYIAQIINDEEDKFRSTLEKGRAILAKQIANTNVMTGEWLFDFYQTYGFPPELALEELSAITNTPTPKGETLKNILARFQKAFDEHKASSRAGSEKKFKGGLGDTSEQSLKYHTATHLLNAALHKVLGDHISQKGSNITPERLRFDFTHGEKMTKEQIAQVEELVNTWIQMQLPVVAEEMPKEQAVQTGAFHVFNDNYGDTVKVYSIGKTETGFVSREFCGGPHVENTSVLGHFAITKEEAVAAGIRRIKATLS